MSVRSHTASTVGNASRFMVTSGAAAVSMLHVLLGGRETDGGQDGIEEPQLVDSLAKMKHPLPPSPEPAALVCVFLKLVLILQRLLQLHS